MTEKRPGAPLDARDFEAIQAAVMETERGRWFLGELARRNRHGETKILLDAIGRLEHTIGGPARPEAGGADPARDMLAEIAAGVGRAAAELGSGEGGDGGRPFESFARSAVLVDAATSDIHDAAERVGETAWRLREAGTNGALCDALEEAAADISTACAFAGATAARAASLARALAAIADALSGSPPRPDPAASADPSRPAEPKARRATAPVVPVAGDAAPTAVDRPPAPSADPEPAGSGAPAEPAPEPRRMPVPSLAAIDALDFRERLKLFT